MGWAMTARRASCLTLAHPARLFPAEKLIANLINC
jgi:hypothetical protein